MLSDAKWIAAADTEATSPLFRKTFNLDQIPTRSILTACCLGYGVLTLNGTPVCDEVLNAPMTRFDRTVLYSTYEVTRLLRLGENVLGVMLGTGWYSEKSAMRPFAEWYHHPKFLLSLDLQWPDLQRKAICSDPSWKSSDGPVVYNYIRCGERYDARLEKKGFDCPDYNDTDWAEAHICRSPGGVLKPAELPPIRVVDTLPMKEIAPSLYDCGQNLSGWAKIRLKGEPGQKISLHYDEALNEKGELLGRVTALSKGEELRHTDEYICAGGWDEWEPHFCCHGFRYVKVDNAPKEFEIAAREVHTDLKTVGTFSCSDELLNRIHSACRWSTLTNFHSIPTDCPHREQNGWTGDALFSAEQSLMNFDMTEAYRKWLFDFHDVQRPSGQIPAIIPSSGRFSFNFGSGPSWDSALILIPLYVWRYCKDDRLIRDSWDVMERYMDFAASMADHFIVSFGLPDWCPPKTTKVCPVALVDTAFYYADACAMAEMAEVLGKNSRRYRLLSEKIRNAFREKFLVNGLPQPEGQTALACVLFNGLLNESEKPAAAARLAELVKENGYHIDCGTQGNKFIYRALSDAGYSDVVYKMITNPTCPSFAYWIHQGATTLCETWEMDASLNHHMFSEVDLWFYRYLAGIQADGETLTIAPVFVDGIDWVKATYRDISVSWDKENVTVVTPKNAILILDGEEIPLTPGTVTYSRAKI